MSENDDRIRETLRREEAELLEQAEIGATLQEVMIDAYRGRHRWLNVIAFAWTFVALGMAIFAAYQFFQSESTQTMIAWATAYLGFSLWIAMLKIWFWMEMQRLPIAREIKRLELRIAELQRGWGRTFPLVLRHSDSSGYRVPWPSLRRPRLLRFVAFYLPAQSVGMAAEN